MTSDDSPQHVAAPADESRRCCILWAVLPPAVSLVIATVIGASGSNQALFLGINSACSSLADAFWSHVTLLGDTLVMMSLLVFLFRKRPGMLCALYVAALVATPVIRICKPLLNVLRPPGVLAEGAFHLIGPSFSQSSFPSGHATTAFAFAAVIVLMLARPWWARASVIAAAAVVALSRVAIGIHWPLDVVGGATLGWVAGAVGVVVARRTSWYVRPVWVRILGASAVATSLALTLYVPEDLEPALATQRVIGGACLIWGIREFVMTWRDARAGGEAPHAGGT